jgi:hypothetical protein
MGLSNGSCIFFVELTFVHSSGFGCISHVWSNERTEKISQG